MNGTNTTVSFTRSAARAAYRSGTTSGAVKAESVRESPGKSVSRVCGLEASPGRSYHSAALGLASR